MRRLLVLSALIAVSLVAIEPGSPAAGGPCTASETRATVLGFARAWTRGDLGAVARLVAQEPHFRWVSAAPPGGRAGSRAFNRASLGAFIRARHAHHERLTIETFKFNGSDVRDGVGFGHFEFTATRVADDSPAGADPLRNGKGAIVCTLARPMIAVWSLG